MSRKSRQAPIIVVTLFFLSAICSGQEVINLSSSSADSEYPAIAANHFGEILVVWSEYGNIYYRIYRDGVWSSIRDSQLRIEFAIISQVDVDGAGNFHIAYADGYSSSTREIFHSVYYRGQGWGSPQQVCDNGLNSAWNRISVDGDHVYIMWFQEVGGGSEAEIAINWKTIGQSWDNNWENVSQNRVDTSIHPAFDVVDGRVFAVYMEGTENNWDIVFNERFGGGWQGSYPIGTSHWPALCADIGQNVFAAFYGSGRFNYRERIGGEWGGLEVISTGRAEKGFGDVKSKNNAVVAAWSQGSPTGVSIFYRFKFLGSSWVDAQEIDGGIEAYYPLIALDEEGSAHIVWEDIGQGGQRDIYYRRVFLIEPDRPYLDVEPSILTFSASQGETKTQTLRIRNSGKGSLTFSLSANKSWLSTSPSAGSSSSEWVDVAVQVRAGQLAPGDHTGTITIVSTEAANSPRKIQVILKVKEAPPTIQLDRNDLSFVATEGESNPADQVFQIRNSGGGSLDYSIVSGSPWLSVSPSQGASAGEWDSITVKVDITGLDVGDYTATLNIRSSSGSNSPQQVRVSLRVNLPPYPYQPLSVNLERMDFVGLFIQVYVNRISWIDNPKNSGRFVVRKFRIYRKSADASGDGYILVGEVPADQSPVYSDEFDSPSERDGYGYCVTAVDDLDRESKRSVVMAGVNAVKVFKTEARQSKRLVNENKKIR